MNQRKHSHIVTLMSRYYEVIDKITQLKEEAASLKQDILDTADPGRYDKYSVSRVKKAEIHVRAYTRHAYYTIRRKRI